MNRLRVASRLLGIATLALLAVGVGGVPDLVAQEGAGPPAGAVYGERVDVELVNVDVWVADGEGDAVTGLGVEEFEVLHDGSPVEISHFTEVRGGTSVQVVEADAAADAPDPGARATGTAETIPSHVVVYFDQSRLHPTNYPPLISGLEEFLATENVDPDRVLILRQDRSLSIAAPFGSTRSELTQALERLAKGTASGAQLQAETDQALAAIRRSWEDNQDTASSASVGIASIPQSTPGGSVGGGAPAGGPRATVGGVGTGGGSDACGSFIGQIQPVLSSWARSRGARAAVTLSNLSDVASFVAGLPGVKTLLYLSDGLDTNPGTALANYAAGFCPSGSVQFLSNARFEDMTPRFLELTRHANTNRVTIYALQASGLRTPRGSSAARGRRARGGSARSGGSFEQSQRASERQGLELIAGETGGRAVFNQNEFGSELEGIARESGTYYSLAYSQPEGGKGREHRIEVRLRDTALTTRYRRGYVEKDSLQRLSERVEGALNLGLTENPLDVRLGAGAIVPSDGGSFRMALLVMVPAERLAFLPRPGSEGLVAEIVVRVMTRALDSSVMSVFDKTFQVKGAPGAAGFAQLAIELELAGGAHVTAVGVQDAGSGEAAFVSTTLQMGTGG